MQINIKIKQYFYFVSLYATYLSDDYNAISNNALFSKKNQFTEAVLFVPQTLSISNILGPLQLNKQG